MAYSHESGATNSDRNVSPVRMGLKRMANLGRS